MRTSISPITVFALALLCLSFVMAAETTAPDENQDAEQSDTNALPSRPTRTTPRERAAAKRAARDSAAQAQKNEGRSKWLAKLKQHDVDPWPEEETDKEHAEALTKSRDMANEVVSLFPETQLYETEHFLFVTNIPPQQVSPYVASLDRMYEWMCRLYGVEREHKVWLGGKAPIFAFLEKEQFDAFEERYFPEAKEALQSLAGVYGLSHLAKGGNVVIACYRGNNPNDFAQMLVHETSHGFIHRYKTKAQLPNWVNEGMADLIGAEMVPASMVVRNREYRAIEQLTQQRSFGGMLSAERIDAGQYGMASNLNRFLMQSNREKYVRFIEALKEGMKWEDALQDAYHSTPDELLAHYGRMIGVADLRP